MKIIKSNEFGKNVFDTADISFCEPYSDSTKGLTPLHHSHKLSDSDFLKSHFPPEHRILNNLGNSYYYALGEIQDILEQEAVSEIIAFGQSKRSLATPELEDKINKALEVFNNSSTPEIAIKHREICTGQMVNSCSLQLTSEQLDKVKTIALDIARSFTQEQNRTVGKRY